MRITKNMIGKFISFRYDSGTNSTRRGIITTIRVGSGNVLIWDFEKNGYRDFKPQYISDVVEITKNTFKLDISILPSTHTDEMGIEDLITDYKNDGYSTYHDVVNKIIYGLQLNHLATRNQIVNTTFGIIIYGKHGYKLHVNQKDILCYTDSQNSSSMGSVNPLKYSTTPQVLYELLE
ncbi:hypothetical protein LCGC14_2789080, partial [marine sediment metagenome]